MISKRLNALRAEMEKKGIDAYIIGTADPHQSEYPPNHWEGRTWLTGFTGSAGTAIVTKDHAGLWTDSRYYLQAETELNSSGFVLHKLIIQTQAEYMDWLVENLPSGSKVGCDFWCFSLSQVEAFDKTLGARGIKLVDCGDLLTEIWKDRPALSTSPVYEHKLEFAGKSRGEKLKMVQAEIAKKKADYLLVSALDEIAYILNARGKDVLCNPVFVAYLLIGKKECDLYILDGKVDPALQQTLSSDGVHCHSYHTFPERLTSLTEQEKIWIDASTISAKITFSLPKGSLIQAPSSIMHMKASKNEVEMQHIRNVMEKDGAALVNAFRWLEHQLKSRTEVTEYEMGQKIAECRALQANYIGESFTAIVGYQSNGAIIHYHPEKETCKTIQAEGILLLDSGGQYEDGTTDITRTIALGPVDDSIKKQYTAVLKGHISLAVCVFPEGTKGIQFDILARQYLWNLGLNYAHGTGHGVGFFMNVHEPPQGFVSAWNQRGSSEFKAGMYTSNEPGYYQEGSHGIRIENLVLAVPFLKNDYGNFLRFETVTLFPIDTQLIYRPDFGQEFVDWLNTYHREVYTRISPHLNAVEKDWLKVKCKEI